MTDITLKNAKFFSLGTYRKSGELVDTPVWFAESDEVYYVFSASQAGKIKRLKNSSRARVAACTATGALIGDWHTASARVLEPSERDIALDALHKKYKWQMRFIDCMSKLAGKYHQRAYIAVQIS